MKIPTPRTDAEEQLYYDGKKSGWVSVDFARQLETETFHLAQLTRRALALLRQPADFKRWDEENDIRNALNNILFPNQGK